MTNNLQTPLAKILAIHNQGESFPLHGIDYFDRFRRIDEYLNKKIHPVVNQGATLADNGWLTDHGPEHITTVMHRASALACSKEETFLKPYEIYLLLLAIHFHDVGNVFGRVKHEQKISEVMKGISEDIIGESTPELRMIQSIATAHGGYANYATKDKDTITNLDSWDGKSHNTKLVAALLRFADELADDYTRTSRFLIDSVVPDGSMAYHMYADRLRQVDVDVPNRSVSLTFDLDISHVQRKYGKAKDEVYLIDEIVERILKMHLEQTYCHQFLVPHVVLDTLRATVNITTDSYLKVVGTHACELKRGYPEAPKTWRSCFPDLAELDGETFQKQYYSNNSMKPEPASIADTNSPENPSAHQPRGLFGKLFASIKGTKRNA